MQPVRLPKLRPPGEKHAHVQTSQVTAKRNLAESKAVFTGINLKKSNKENK
jgi:hypothetical protein